MTNILIVDDEPEIRQLIRMHIERIGLNVQEAHSGKTAVETMKKQRFELIILDIMMDDGNGYEVLQFIKEKNLKTIIIALSAKKNLHDKIYTLDAGADDYVTKPFSPMELLARVQAQLRRNSPSSSNSSKLLKVNNLILDVENCILQTAHSKHPLTPVECELLQFFMQNIDQVLTKREIYKQIWQHENYDDNNLSVFISRLRKILEATTGSSNYLQSVRGIGYRFSGDTL